MTRVPQLIKLPWGLAQKQINKCKKDRAQNCHARNLARNNFEVFVIPMVNPDGVIHGMSRTNMAGLDLNRHWGDNILKV